MKAAVACRVIVSLTRTHFCCGQCWCGACQLCNYDDIDICYVYGFVYVSLYWSDVFGDLQRSSIFDVKRDHLFHVRD